jgi:sulfatase modifying factor 1
MPKTTKFTIVLFAVAAFGSAQTGCLMTSVTAAYKEPASDTTFVYVKGGCYQMGDTFGDGLDREKPVHEVCVNDFYIGTHEVTQGQWKKLMGYNPSKFSSCGDNCPVEMVSWDEAQEFIRKFNQQTGKTYRLPTEAEWEYAARERGKKVRFGTGTDFISSNTANYDGSSYYNQKYSEAGEFRKKTLSVGSFKPNSLGLYDMAGNVQEWCSDWFDDKYYKASPRDNPQGPPSGKYHVTRGGDWFISPGEVRASWRSRGNGSGFRLARYR